MIKLIEKLGIYELLTYIFTGLIFYFSTLSILFFMKYIDIMRIKECIKYLDSWYILVLVYFSGLILHEISEIYERVLFCKGMPSERIILDTKYQKMKELVFEKLKNKTNKEFNFEDRNQSNIAFGIIYSTVQDTTANDIIQKMNQQYGLFRTLSLGFILQLILFLFLVVHSVTQNSFETKYLLLLISIFFLILITSRRMVRFGYRISDYCYRNYVK